jgi:hypothetical protein
MEHPPYFPCLAPNDFWLFPELKSALKEQRVQDIEDIQKKKYIYIYMVMALKAIPQQEFQKCF